MGRGEGGGRGGTQVRSLPESLVLLYHGKKVRKRKVIFNRSTQIDYQIVYTDKKKRKFSSYIRKFRMEQLQSHIWLTASSYTVKYLRISSFPDFATAPF